MTWRFEDPWLLSLLVLLPFFLYWNLYKSRTGAIQYSSIERLKKLPHRMGAILKYMPVSLRIVILVFLVLALARPQSGTKTQEISSEGVDIILAIDTSGSMQALDFEINKERVDRLTVVKNVVNDFIKDRDADRIGMVVFGAEAFTQSPLTYDHGVVLDFLDNVSIGMAGDATAIGSAIGIAVKRLKDLKAKSKVIILLTDGQNNAGRLSPEKASEIAKKYQIKIYTIGAGTKGRAPFPTNTPFGRRYVYQQVDIDEETLKNIANTTGGKYFRATDTESLKDIYKQINQLEKTEIKIAGYIEYDELFFWFLIPGFCLLITEIVLSNTKLRRIP